MILLPITPNAYHIISDNAYHIISDSGGSRGGVGRFRESEPPTLEITACRLARRARLIGYKSG